MISVNLPENSQDSSQSALELLKPDPPLEQKAEAKIQGNLLKGIQVRLSKELDSLGQQVFIVIFSLFKLEKFLQKKYWTLMVLNQEINFRKKKLQFPTVLFPHKKCVT